MHVNYAIIIGMTASITKNKVLPSLADITSEQRIINPEKDGLDGIPAVTTVHQLFRDFFDASSNLKRGHDKTLTLRTIILRLLLAERTAPFKTENLADKQQKAN